MFIDQTCFVRFDVISSNSLCEKKFNTNRRCEYFIYVLLKHKCHLHMANVNWEQKMPQFEILHCNTFIELEVKYSFKPYDRRSSGNNIIIILQNIKWIKFKRTNSQNRSMENQINSLLISQEILLHQGQQSFYVICQIRQNSWIRHIHKKSLLGIYLRKWSNLKLISLSNDHNQFVGQVLLLILIYIPSKTTKHSKW